MTNAKILDGKLVAAHIQEQLAAELGSINRPVHLKVILVGEDPASHIYVNQKHKACEKVGITSSTAQFDESLSQADLLAEIKQLNQDPDTHGILVQLPLPSHIEPLKVLEAIDPAKDIDGFHPTNVGRLAIRAPGIRPCTPRGMMRLLEHYDIDVKRMDAVVVGASNIVGRPMSLELLLAGASVQVCHRFTQNLEAKVRQADLVVAAAGKQGLIQGDWIKPGAIVLDVGIHRTPTGLCGDVDFTLAAERASWISPVPGGVGPMTVAMLMSNTIEAFKLQNNL